MKTALYKSPSYCLSFGDDCVFLDIEVEITRLHEQRKEFAMKVLKAQLDPSQEAFPIFVMNYLSPELLGVLREDLISRLISELTPQLFSLFYSSDVTEQNDNTTA